MAIYDYMHLSNEENVVRGHTQWVMVVMRGGVGLGWSGGEFSLFTSLYWLNCFTGHNKHILLWLFQNINRERKTKVMTVSISFHLHSLLNIWLWMQPTSPHPTSLYLMHVQTSESHLQRDLLPSTKIPGSGPIQRMCPGIYEAFWKFWAT